MEHPTFEEALYFVDKESPASPDDLKKQMANALIDICIRENEPIERAWLIEKYWE